MNYKSSNPYTTLETKGEESQIHSQEIINNVVTRLKFITNIKKLTQKNINNIIVIKRLYNND